MRRSPGRSRRYGARRLNLSSRRPFDGAPLLSRHKAISIQITRTGHGRPILLVHGLGSTRHAWNPILPGLAAEREVIALDLPGHNGVPVKADSGTFAGLAAGLEALLKAVRLVGIDMVGSSLGAQLVLEMARLGKAGATVALDPSGFWMGLERS